MKKITHQWTNRSEHYASVTEIAELIRLQSSAFSAALNHKSENTNPYGGSAKAVVESSFRILQAEFQTRIPGYVGKKSRGRGGRPCALLVEDDTPR